MWVICIDSALFEIRNYQHPNFGKHHHKILCVWLFACNHHKEAFGQTGSLPNSLGQVSRHQSAHSPLEESWHVVIVVGVAVAAAAAVLFAAVVPLILDVVEGLSGSRTFSSEYLSMVSMVMCKSCKKSYAH